MKTIKILFRKSFWTINKLIPLPVALHRYILTFIYDKEEYKLKGNDQVFSTIYDSNFWGSDESRSGGGSALDATMAIRELLPRIFVDYSIKSILDVPCGDFNWMKEVEKSFLDKYYGGDIVPQLIKINNDRYSSEKIQFVQIDITKDYLPPADLIFCRDCLQHLSEEKIFNALQNFKKSKSKYLLVTSYYKTLRNHDIYDGDYRALNLRKKPFNFPEPLKVIKESKSKGSEIDKAMNLYKISDIPNY